MSKKTLRKKERISGPGNISFQKTLVEWGSVKGKKGKFFQSVTIDWARGWR